MNFAFVYNRNLNIIYIMHIYYKQKTTYRQEPYPLMDSHHLDNVTLNRLKKGTVRSPKRFRDLQRIRNHFAISY